MVDQIRNHIGIELLLIINENKFFFFFFCIMNFLDTYIHTYIYLKIYSDFYRFTPSNILDIWWCFSCLNFFQNFELKIKTREHSKAREFNFVNSFIPGADFRRPQHT